MARAFYIYIYMYTHLGQVKCLVGAADCSHNNMPYLEVQDT